MVSFREESGPQIPLFYAGRSIFITGATGFMGKVLVERLLATCPHIDQIFLLLRAKKDQAPEHRLQQLKESEVFANIQATCPHQLDKLNAVSGDITMPGLGLEPDSVSLLRNVSIVFHSAATLKFHEPLSQAVNQNVRSVIRVLDLCDSLPNIQALVYVSTAYSNSDLSVVEERVYPPPASLDSLLALTDAVPDDVLKTITDKYISPKPNTYTFTKAMAETAVEQHGCASYPIAIFRPSIVISALRNPFPGWVENLNGPTGVVVAAGKGLLHVFQYRPGVRADMIPVDLAIDTLLATAWEIATDKSSKVRVYNCTTYRNPTTWEHFEKSLRMNIRVHPVDKAFWWPFGVGVESRFAQIVLETLLHTIPLHLAEYISRIIGIKNKFSLIMVSNRLRAMNEVLKFFSGKEWHFASDNVEKLQQKLSAQDAAIYNLDPKSINWEEQYENFVKGTKKYVLKEKEENLAEAKRHMRRMHYIHNGLVLFTFALFVRLCLGNRFVNEVVHGGMRLMLTVYDSLSSKITALSQK